MWRISEGMLTQCLVVMENQDNKSIAITSLSYPDLYLPVQFPS